MTSSVTSVPPRGSDDRGSPRQEGETTSDGDLARLAATFAGASPPPSSVHPIRILDDLISALVERRQREGDERQQSQTRNGREGEHSDGNAPSGQEGGLVGDISSPPDPDPPRDEEGDPFTKNLSTLPRRRTQEHDDDSWQSQERRRLRDHHVDTILRAADFLFPPESHGSLLESAIAVLDSSSSGSSSSPPPPVRRVIASPSGRVAYFVRGGSSSSAWSSAKKRRTGDGGGGDGPATPCLSSSPGGPSPPPPTRRSSSRSTTEYVCLLGEYVTPAENAAGRGGSSRGGEDGLARLRSYHSDDEDIDGGGGNGECPGGWRGNGRRSRHESYYCTCRSFYEKFKRAYGPEASSGGDNAVVLCKHLLAAKLAPHLLGDDFCEVVVSEETFAVLMVQSCCC